jgi:hypothetical protein
MPVTVIYAMVDPRDEVIRYVGKTTRPLHVRLASHFSRPTNEEMSEWLTDLKTLGLKPKMVSLLETDEETAGIEEVKYIEAYWATLYNNLKCTAGRKFSGILTKIVSFRFPISLIEIIESNRKDETVFNYVVNAILYYAGRSKYQVPDLPEEILGIVERLCKERGETVLEFFVRLVQLAELQQCRKK